MLRSGSSFPPFFTLASPSSSQRLREARYWQDNHHLIQDFIGSRLDLKSVCSHMDTDMWEIVKMCADTGQL